MKSFTLSGLFSTVARWTRNRGAAEGRPMRPFARPSLEALEDRTLLSAGALDPTFGLNLSGKVTTDSDWWIGGEPDLANAMALQPDGKILVAGLGALEGRTMVLRYNANGLLDDSFGRDRNGVSPIWESGIDSRSIAVQADGRIVVGGSGVGRLNSDGSLDSTFGVSGHVQLRGFGGIGLALQPDGKIVVAGTIRVPQLIVAVVRLNTDGSLDNTFDGDGMQTIDFGSTNDNDEATGVALQSDGRIVVAGYSSDLGTGVTGSEVARLNSDGSLDTSFGVGGKQVVDFGSSGGSVVYGVAVQRDDKIVLTGSAWDNAGSSDFGVARLNSDGTQDTSFGNAGKQTIDFGSTIDVSNALAVQPDGKTVLAGTSYPGAAGFDFAVARLDSDGFLDLSFGSGGKQTIDFGPDFDSAVAVAVQLDSKIVLAGNTYTNTNSADIALARVLGITDADDDGIEDAVDMQPTQFSNDFSDGTTSGTITARGDQNLTILDVPAEGVIITADFLGGATPATISVVGGASVLSLSPGDQVIVTQGSVLLNVLAGIVQATFVAESGQVATASLASGTRLTFQPETFTFIAPASNTQTVQVLVNGTELSVIPGQAVVGPRAVTVDIRPESVNVDSNGTLTVVIFGAVDFAASQIDVGSVQFAGAAAWQFTWVDINNDGHLDLQLKFRTQDTILDQIYADLLRDDADADGVLDSTRQTAEVAVTGQTVDGELFSGSDDLTLFLSGRALRDLLDELFG